MEKKITKITIEYDDGFSKSLTSSDADVWMTIINSMCINLHNRGQNPFDKIQFNWIENNVEDKKES